MGISGNISTATDGLQRHATYDAWNRMVEVCADSSGSPGATIATYSYDGLRRRVRKVAPAPYYGTDTHDNYYSAAWQLLEVRKNSDPDPLDQYIWGMRYIDAAVIRFHDANTDGLYFGSDTLYYTNDANMNVTALVNTGGIVQERYSYDAYGKPTFLSSGWTVLSTQASQYSNPILYAGYHYDEETGLYNVRNRSYHPTLARWMQTDPLRYVDGMNLYQYCISSPVNHVDSTGLAFGPPSLQTMPTDTLPEQPGWSRAHWTADDWIRHYFFGNGKPVDLREIGLFGRWKREVKKYLDYIEDQVVTDAGYWKWPSCTRKGKDGRKKRGSVSGETHTASSFDRVTTLLDPLYPMGSSTVRAKYTCIMTSTCSCCSGGFKRTRSRIRCTINWELADKFSNPWDFLGVHYTRDVKAYKRCRKQCEQGYSRCISEGRRLRLLDGGRVTCGQNRDLCNRRCEKIYPSAEMPTGTVYPITARWNSNFDQVMETPCGKP